MNVLRDASNRIFLPTKPCARARQDLRRIHGVAEDDTVGVNRYLPTGGESRTDARSSTSFRVCTYLSTVWLATDITWPHFIARWRRDGGGKGAPGLIIYSDKDARPRYWPIKNPRYGRTSSRIYSIIFLFPAPSPPLLHWVLYCRVRFFAVAGSPSCWLAGGEGGGWELSSWRSLNGSSNFKRHVMIAHIVRFRVYFFSFSSNAAIVNLRELIKVWIVFLQLMT